jgi:YHS domain-containing protein
MFVFGLFLRTHSGRHGPLIHHPIYEEKIIMAIDPVCHMEVNEEKAAGHADYNGKDYYFCSRSCEEKFEHDPAQYIESAA